MINDIFILIYCIKSEFNSWEPAENLSSDLIAEYENSNREDTDVDTDAQQQPDKIIGLSIASSGQLMFVTKWKHSKKLNLVSAKTAKTKWPHLVIKFYKTCSVFKNK